MDPMFGWGLRIIWALLLLYWLWSARTAKRSALHEPLWQRLLLYWLPLVAAVLLLGPGEWFGRSLLREQFVPHSFAAQTCGLVLCLAGAGLAIWSRRVLGTNWSSEVQLKENHELIERGPYRIIRHPIYLGLLTLFLGNAILVGDWRGLLAVAIVFASFWRKLRVEERWLGRNFGRSYQDYVRRTHALLPGIL
jgi:protein-S-isoprenylcysteine O-methyltransferase Ste14